ncbi:MAG: hypothetical protein VB070_04385 [Clostridiaceae bacterium]|nr:hypothetical protein [Clostridiaceae bacterium]
MYQLLAYERETIIQMDDGSKMALVYTRQKAMIKILERLLLIRPDEVHLIKRDADGQCLYVKLPKKWIRIGPPKKMKLTDEQRAARSERIRCYNAKSKSQKPQQCMEN